MAVETAQVLDTVPAHDLQAARAAVIADWHRANPHTPDAILSFYQHSPALAAELEAWHALPDRQAITAMLVHVARESGAQTIIDIGCGVGHDLRALAAALPAAHLIGIEPNHALRRQLPPAVAAYEDAAEIPLAAADMLLCIDVLEHVVNPAAFLEYVSARARSGCLLFETVATFDLSTPLHLSANAGWHPGHVLESHGWELIDATGRVRVWRRVQETARQRASLLLCAYRSVALDTMQAILGTVNGGAGWRLRAKGGDALISRSRAIVTTAWWRETADDVFLMVDDDLVFSPSDADRLSELCRGGYDVICGAYPVRNGAHFACRFQPGTTSLAFGPGQPPLEIVYAATGFLAVHRRVLDAMVATLPLCHAQQTWSFYPFFQPSVVEEPGAGGHEWLSEDYGFSALARSLGFRIWCDPQIRLTHQATIGITVTSMEAIHDAIDPQ